MTFNRFFILFICIITTLNVVSQGMSSTSNFTESQKKVIQLDESGQAYFYHSISIDETLYTICKRYNASVQEVIEINNIADSQNLTLNTSLVIPFNTDQINTELNPKDNELPIYYKVKKQETLYRIAKVYFNQEVESLVMRNKLQGFGLDLGQELIIGYYPFKTIKLESRNVESIAQLPAKNNPSSIESMSYKGEVVIDSKGNSHLLNNGELVTETNDNVKEVALISNETTTKYSQIKKKGIAFWDKGGADYQTLMVLHKDAVVNTSIEIRNAITGQTAIATVVGNIPKDAFKKDIDIVLSPAVAKKIGALDSRLQVEMVYSR